MNVLFPFRRKKISSFQNVLFGIAGGMAGTLVMGYYFKAIGAISGKNPMLESPQDAPRPLQEIAVTGPHYRPAEPSTAVLGRLLYTKLKGREPGLEQQMKLANAVHWTYGGMMGGLYGALNDKTKLPETASGLAYGSALWVLGNNLAVPALGLAKGPGAFTTLHHAHTLFGHWLYGLTVSCVRGFLSRCV